jgi:hypothetical protein
MGRESFVEHLYAGYSLQSFFLPPKSGTQKRISASILATLNREALLGFYRYVDGSEIVYCSNFVKIKK